MEKEKIMKFLSRLIRLIFYPIKIIHWIVYGTDSPKVVGYAWYDQKNYRRVIENSNDVLDSLIANHDKWKEKAEKTIQDLKNRGWLVFKVKIEYDELNRWLKKNGLSNTSENREIYVEHTLNLFLEKGEI